MPWDRDQQFFEGLGIRRVRSGITVPGSGITSHGIGISSFFEGLGIRRVRSGITVPGSGITCHGIGISIFLRDQGSEG